MRVDEYITVTVKAETKAEAADRALDILAPLGTPFRVSDTRYTGDKHGNYRDHYGKYTVAVLVVPDWRGYDGS